MINRDNYLRVREYLKYQTEVLQRDILTVETHRGWLKHLLRWADSLPFADVSRIRPIYPQYLLKVSSSHGKPLGIMGLKRGCLDARMFFQWLLMKYARLFPKLDAAWIDTLQPPRVAVEPRKEHEAVRLEMVRRLLTVQGEPDNLGLRRDKAAAALLFLSGARASAFVTLTLECVNIRDRTIKQYPHLGVRTKNKKAALTTLLDIPDLLHEVEQWDSYVRARLPLTAPWYSVIEASFGEQKITANAPGRFRHMGLGDNVRKLFRLAGLRPLSPHKFRHGHAVYCMHYAQDYGDIKALSMNLMHSHTGVTDGIYGVLSDKDTHERISNLGGSVTSDVPSGANAKNELISQVRELLKRLEGL
jgi:integrase